MSDTSKRLRAEWKVNDAKRDAGLATPEDVERFDERIYGPYGRENSLDVYRPKKEQGKRLPVIVSIHGGGWVYGDKELYQFYCMSLAQRGFAVVNFTYRLAPEAKFPAQLEDTNRVIEWVLAHADEYDLDRAHIFLVGDSAGAHLAGLYTAICTDPAYAAEYPFQVPEGFVPSAVALNCGAYVPLLRGSANWDMNLELMRDLLPEGGTEEELRKVNVITHVNRSFPPVYLMSCYGDFLLEQMPLMEDRLKELGVPYRAKVYGSGEQPLYHVFHVTVQEPEGQKCNDDECAFFRSVIRA